MRRTALTSVPIQVFVFFIWVKTGTESWCFKESTIVCLICWYALSTIYWFSWTLNNNNPSLTYLFTYLGSPVLVGMQQRITQIIGIHKQFPPPHPLMRDRPRHWGLRPQLFLNTVEPPCATTSRKRLPPISDRQSRKPVKALFLTSYKRPLDAFSDLYFRSVHYVT